MLFLALRGDCTNAASSSAIDKVLSSVLADQRTLRWLVNLIGSWCHQLLPSSFVSEVDEPAWCSELVNRRLVQKVHAIRGDQLVSDLACHRVGYIDRRAVLPRLFLVDALEHRVLPAEGLLRVYGPSAHHHILIKQLATVQRASDRLFHVIAQSVHRAVSSDQSVDVLLYESEKLGLSQARAVWGYEAPENLDEEGLQLLD